MWQFDKSKNTYVPGILPADGSKITACYCRLSQENEQDGDSGSILNQRDFLLKYCTDNHFSNIRFFCDDGFSGVNFNRPDFTELMELVEQKKIATLVTKDLSRLGRNYLKTGELIEIVFPENDVRYIAVNDGVDTAREDNEFTPLRNWFNEFYARDTSKKIRAVLTNKGNQGERTCTQIPYGYVGNKHNWELDPEAAEVVQRIFSMCIAGLGPAQIAKQLWKEKILTPNAHKHSKGIVTPTRAPENPYSWATPTVISILQRKEYTGCTVNFKYRRKSYKIRKSVAIPPEERREFPGTHPAIIDMETWERVQELRRNKRRFTSTGRQGLFSGLLYCADCGKKLYFKLRRNVPNQDHYICSGYLGFEKSCSAHTIRETVLHDLVLEHIQQTIYFVRTYESVFVQSIMDRTMAEQKKEQARKQRRLVQAERRIADLDVLFQRIYEDNISGKLSDERFSKLSASYEAEQHDLTSQAQALHAEFELEQAKAVNVEQFIALVRKYTEIQTLTPAIVNELIKRIVVHAADKSSGKRIQKIDIEYNFVGKITVCLSKLKVS